jgi:hypothetical protein
VKTEVCFFCYSCNGPAFAIVDEPLPVQTAEVPRHDDCEGRTGLILWQQPFDAGCQMMGDEWEAEIPG